MKPNILRIHTSAVRYVARLKSSISFIERRPRPQEVGLGTVGVLSVIVRRVVNMVRRIRLFATRGYVHGGKLILFWRLNLIDAVGSRPGMVLTRRTLRQCARNRVAVVPFVNKRHLGYSLIILTRRAKCEPYFARPVTPSWAGTKRRPKQYFVSRHTSTSTARADFDRACHADILLEMIPEVERKERVLLRDDARDS